MLFSPCFDSRYHNGRHLQEESFENITNLFIPNVTGASQGFYTCKATNDYGSEISTPAELKIKSTYVKVSLRAKWPINAGA